MRSIGAVRAGLCPLVLAPPSIASGWVGGRAKVGRAQASSLYNLFCYSGSSVVGWAGGMVFAGWGWTGISAMVVLLIATALALTVVGARRLKVA